MAHLTKIQNRHERDLVKLKPVTLQAPDAANKETDLISCLTDIMSERMMRQQKQLFVTRNEFQSLSDLLPDTTAHFVCELEGLTKQISAFDTGIKTLKTEIQSDKVVNKQYFNDVYVNLKNKVAMDRFKELENAIEERVHLAKF